MLTYQRQRIGLDGRHVGLGGDGDFVQGQGPLGRVAPVKTELGFTRPRFQGNAGREDGSWILRKVTGTSGEREFDFGQ